MDFARISTAIENVVYVVVQARDNVEEITADVEDILWVLHEKIREIESRRQTLADASAQPSEPVKPVSLDETLDFIAEHHPHLESIRQTLLNDPIARRNLMNNKAWMEQNLEYAWNHFMSENYSL